MKKLVIFALLSTCAYAESEKRLIEVKNIPTSHLGNFLGAFGVGIWPSPNDHFVAISGTKEQLDTAEAAIRKIDVGPKDIQIEFQIVAASSSGQDKVPQDLDPVVRQLKKTFVYQNFRLIDSIELRTREGKLAEGSSAVQTPDANSQMSMYHVRFTPTVSGDDKGVMIRMDNLQFGARIPVLMQPVAPGTTPAASAPFNYIETGITQNVDVREGQKVVVGRANLNGRDGAFFLIVTAKVVE